jgi:hypothetical protein
MAINNLRRFTAKPMCYEISFVPTLKRPFLATIQHNLQNKFYHTFSLSFRERRLAYKYF